VRGEGGGEAGGSASAAAAVSRQALLPPSLRSLLSRMPSLNAQPKEGRDGAHAAPGPLSLTASSVLSVKILVPLPSCHCNVSPYFPLCLRLLLCLLLATAIGHCCREAAEACRD